MNLKPFNLERALAGDPVVTRDGRKIIEIIKFNSDINHPIFALVENRINAEWRTLEGKYWDNQESESDLFMIPIKKTYWINIYKNEYGIRLYHDTFFNSKEDAINSKILRNYHSTVHVEIEE